MFSYDRDTPILLLESTLNCHPALTFFGTDALFLPFFFFFFSLLFFFLFFPLLFLSLFFFLPAQRYLILLDALLPTWIESNWDYRIGTLLRRWRPWKWGTWWEDLLRRASHRQIPPIDFKSPLGPQASCHPHLLSLPLHDTLILSRIYPSISSKALSSFDTSLFWFCRLVYLPPQT